MKVYAVRKGRRTGIFSTWGECKKQVHKYHGAEFKSFPTEQEARAYLQASPSTKPKAAGKPKKKKSAKTADPLHRDYDLTFFVDGSFDQGSWTYSYGMVALNPEGEAVWEDGEAFRHGRFASMWNVAGELEGAIAALRFAKSHGASRVLICHDYEGIGRWANGEWKANKAGTKDYVQFVKEMRESGLDIQFRKVKAHSGVRWNERADLLAKEAIQRSRRW